MPLADMAVIVRRRETGSLVQRFVFSAIVSGVTLQFDPGGALVATPRGVWGLGARDKAPPLSAARVTP